MYSGKYRGRMDGLFSHCYPIFRGCNGMDLDDYIFLIGLRSFSLEIRIIYRY